MSATTLVHPADSAVRARRAAATVLLALLATAVVGRLVFLLWEPPFDGAIRYDEIAALGGAYWPMNIFLGGPAWATSFLAAAVFAVLLARGRTAWLGLLGAFLVAGGGLLFAMTITAETLPFAFAADTGIFPEAEGRAIFDVLNAHLGWLLPIILGTQAVVALGFLLVLVAALLSRATPRWFPIAGIAYLIVFLVLPTEQLGFAAVVAGQVIQCALLVGIAWFGRLALTAPRAAPPA
ncbi:hypothetical protein [Microbacterium album]|uniref:DUF4386 domain-containing protein n=1 Tax=Microbacterium album TaxID=2053191 RepID=A0A917IEM2_9MICO|nr:hypothetical protein [Microbacterium album]GGH45271.1 hypothetical protein GCM10010921_20540 [Microbacterium album]